MAEIKKIDYASMGHRLLSLALILLVALSVSLFTGCSGSSGSDDTDNDTTGDTADGETDSEGDGNDFDDSALESDYDEGDYTWDSDEEILITLGGTSITVGGGDAVVDGSEVTIVSAGTYRLSGPLTDGRVVVDTQDTEVVRLVFDGVDIRCSDSAPVYVASAERTVIILEGDDNYLEDASSYVYGEDEDEPNAALHSKSYLTLGGSGSLTVTGNYNDGITGKDGLIINSGTITVTSVDDGIRGKDYILVKDGDINVTTTGTGDGLLSDNEEDTEKGYILIEAGEFNIDAREDAIQAETYVIVYDGVFNLTSGGGAGTSFSGEDSKKGIKGVAGVQIEGGDFTIDAADDAVHSNDFVIVNDGVFDMASGDDGIHADATLDIYGGDVSISESYEGLESSILTIEDGEFYIVSSDDGLNVAGGNDGSGMNGPGGGFEPGDIGDYAIYIDGGYLAVYADGDGIDSNGDIEMTAGTVLVHGPTSDGDGALDYQGSFNITGGFLAAAGSSGMAEAPSSSSTQYSVLLNFSEKNAGTLFHIETDGGEEMLTFSPSKRYESIVFSGPDLSDGASYNVYSGGSATGTEIDGLHTGGVYSAGTHESDLDFTISSIVTTVGSGGGSGPPGG
jgi:hypothetical protein